MSDLIQNHPDDRVRAAAIQFLDALTSWERSTGRHNVVIVKDSIGVQIRTMNGGPVPEDIDDAMLLEAFDNLAKEQA